MLSKFIKSSLLNNVTEFTVIIKVSLDFSEHNLVHPDRQRMVMSDQVKIGLEHNLPIVLHLRNALSKGLKILD